MTSQTRPPPKTSEAERQENARKKRLAERLRANLQKRKAQSRARRAGEADERPDGLLQEDDGDADK
jgi:hypothetical protein